MLPLFAATSSKSSWGAGLASVLSGTHGSYLEIFELSVQNMYKRDCQDLFQPTSMYAASTPARL